MLRWVRAFLFGFDHFWAPFDRNTTAFGAFWRLFALCTWTCIYRPEKHLRTLFISRRIAGRNSRHSVAAGTFSRRRTRRRSSARRPAAHGDDHRRWRPAAHGDDHRPDGRQRAAEPGNRPAACRGVGRREGRQRGDATGGIRHSTGAVVRSAAHSAEADVRLDGRVFARHGLRLRPTPGTARGPSADFAGDAD